MTIPTDAQIVDLVAPILLRHGVPGAAIALVTKHGARTIGIGTLGDGKDSAVSDRDCFQIASLTKAYTATAVATLVARGELGWDDTVQTHIPDFRLYDPRVSELATVRDLLSMRLGLRGEGVFHWGRNHELGVEAVLERLPFVQPVAGFRETLTYYNPAYTLLADIVARRSGMAFETYLDEAVFTPLGLADSAVRTGRTEPLSGKRFAMPHVVLDEGVVPLGELRCGGHLGESGIYSSAHDAVRWMQFHLGRGTIDGKVILPDTVAAEMHQPHVLARGAQALGHDFIAYGMGWQIRDTSGGTILVHEGGEFGISSYTILHPAGGTGVCVYLNANVPVASRSVAHILHDMMGDLPVRDWEARFVSLADQERSAIAAYAAAAFPTDGDEPSLADIAGEYVDPVNGVIEVRADAEGVVMTVLDGWVYDAHLTPLGGGTYRVHCHYAGTRSLARGLNLARFHNGHSGMTLSLPGLGTIAKR